MIAENSFLIPNNRKKDLKDENNYLITAIEVSHVDDDEQAYIEDKFSAISKDIESFVRY